MSDIFILNSVDNVRKILSANMSQLNTDNKNDLVSAINEVKDFVPESVEENLNVFIETKDTNTLTTWKEVQDIVRAGKASYYFNIGDQFIVNKKIFTITTELQANSTMEATIVNYVNLKTKYDSELNSGLTYSFFKYESSGWTVFAYSEGTIVNPSSSISDLESFCGIRVTGTPVVGDKIILNDSTEELAFDVIGFDHDIPTNTNYQHSMTLQLHDCYGSIMFDAREAMWYIEETTYPNGLAIGTYHFIYNSKDYIFTTTKVVPVGGQIYYDKTNISTYASSTSTDKIEFCIVTEGTAENTLPIAGVTNVGVTNVSNDYHRGGVGSNSYANSVIRQYINSSEESNWWQPKSIFDRPPIDDTNIDYRNMPGFLYGIEEEFLAIVGEVNKVTLLDECEAPNEDDPWTVTTAEKFFLLSAPEIYASATEEDYPDGTAYEFYGPKYSKMSNISKPNNGIDKNRVKYYNNGTSWWWLRSPYGLPQSCRVVLPNGAPRYGNAYSVRGVAPAVCIV